MITNKNNNAIVFLVHGIRAKSLGNRTMGKLRDRFISRDVESKMVSYGWVFLPITNKQAVEEVVETIAPYQATDRKIVVVGYSNGAWAAVQAAELGYRIDYLVLISPALHIKHAFPNTIKKIDVYFSQGDWIVVLGKWRSILANLMPWRWKIFGGEPHGWGAMGRYGYSGKDQRVINYDMDEAAKHSFYKHPDILDMIVDNTSKGL